MLSPQDALAAKAVFGLEPRVNTQATYFSEVLSSILQHYKQAVRGKTCRPGLALVPADHACVTAGHHMPFAMLAGKLRWLCGRRCER